MTAFDVAAILIVLVSALVGFARGAVREVVTLVAFGAATVSAVAALPLSARLFSHLVHPSWMAAACGLVVVFVLVYVCLRVAGGELSRRLRGGALGGADRTLGAGFGVVRAAVLLGAFFLLYKAAMPASLSPAWITDGVTWPVARASGQALQKLAPGGGRLGGGVGRMMGEDLKSGFTPRNVEGARDDEAAADREGVVLGRSRRRAPTLDEVAPPDETAPPAAEPRRGLKVRTRSEREDDVAERRRASHPERARRVPDEEEEAR